MNDEDMLRVGSDYTQIFCYMYALGIKLGNAQFAAINVIHLTNSGYLCNYHSSIF